MSTYRFTSPGAMGEGEVEPDATVIRVVHASDLLCRCQGKGLEYYRGSRGSVGWVLEPRPPRVPPPWALPRARHGGWRSGPSGASARRVASPLLALLRKVASPPLEGRRSARRAAAPPLAAPLLAAPPPPQHGASPPRATRYISPARSEPQARGAEINIRRVQHESRRTRQGLL